MQHRLKYFKVNPEKLTEELQGVFGGVLVVYEDHFGEVGH